VFIPLVGSSPSSSDTNLYRLKNLTCTKGHIKTVNSKHKKMLTAGTRSADTVREIQRKRKTTTQNSLQSNGGTLALHSALSAPKPNRK